MRGFPTRSEFTEGVVGVAGGLLQLKEPPGVVHQVLLVLRVHGVHLPVLTALVKQRAQEELREPAGGRRAQASPAASTAPAPLVSTPANYYNKSIFESSRTILPDTFHPQFKDATPSIINERLHRPFLASPVQMAFTIHPRGGTISLARRQEPTAPSFIH